MANVSVTFVNLTASDVPSRSIEVRTITLLPARLVTVGRLERRVFSGHAGVRSQIFVHQGKTVLGPYLEAVT